MSRRRTHGHLGVALVLIALAVLAAIRVTAQQQSIPGRNVNVVGGPTWVTANPFEIVGDPWRTQSVEPDCDVSTRNPSVIVCSAVDYRLVDVPGGFFTQLDATGSAPPHPDSWNMIAQSRDNGLTWMSRPHPGHLLDTSGTATLLKNYQFGADPMIRFGAAGVMLHVGLAANRGDNALGAIYSSTWLHLNNRESDPEPVKFTGLVREITTGVAGQFRDRPHLAMGEPNGRTCTFDVPVQDETGATTTVHQDVPCTTAYVAWASFTGSGKTARAKVMFSKSLNMGKGWTQPLTVNEQVSIISQGAQVVKIPNSRRVIVFWRRGAAQNQPDAIMMAKSDNDGDTFGKAVALASIVPFDQGTTPYSFRFKTMVNTAAGPGRAYVVWADRRDAAGNPNVKGEGRVVIVATDGVTATAPVPVEGVRDASETRTCYQPGAGERCWGHQIFPTVAVAAGRIHVAWTDFRNDASGTFDPEKIDEYANAHSSGTRHTADVFAAEAPLAAEPPPPGSGPPVFAAPFQVSQYLWGRVPEAGGILSPEPRQLQYNVKIARNFNKMTVPFDGDYGSSRGEALVPLDPIGLSGAWGYNFGNATTPRAPAFHDFWTDGRNVELYANEDYNQARRYTPPKLEDLLTIPTDGKSLYDSGQTRPACESGAAGTKNLDTYTARTTGGLYAFAPWNNKTLGEQLYDPTNPAKYGTKLVLRAFPVVVENTSNVIKSVELSIPAQPPGGFASFDQFNVTGLVTSLSINDIPPHSAVAKTVYVTSTEKRAAVRVDVAEVRGENLKTTVFLNPDPSAPENLLQPGQVDAKYDVTRYEVHDAAVEGVMVQDINFQKVSGQGAEPGDQDPTSQTPGWQSPGWQSPGWQSPGWQSPGWQSPGWQSPGWQSPGWQSPGWQSPGWQSPGWQSPGWQSPGWQSPGWQSPGWQSVAFDDGASTRYVIAKVVGKECKAGDATCTNTSTAYDANVLVNGADPDLEYQLVVYKMYATTATSGCEHKLIGNTQVVVNIPYYAPAGTTATAAAARYSTATAAGQPDPRASFALAPGETAYVVLVAFAYGPGREEFKDAWLPPTNVVFNVPPQPVKTDTYLDWVTCGEPGHPPCPPAPPTPAPAPSKPLYMVAPALPWAITQTPYGPLTFQAVGGQGALQWSAVGLPTGITIDPSTGALAGTTTAAGTFPFTVTVTDTQLNISDIQSFTLRVAPLLSLTTTLLPDGITGAVYNQSLAATGGSGTRTWSVATGSLPAGLAMSSDGVISGTPTATGTFAFTAQVAATGPPSQTATRALQIRVATTLAFATSGTLPNAIVGFDYNPTITLNGGTGPFTWNVTSSSLPPGVDWAGNGAFTGIPTAPASGRFIALTVTDSGAPAQSVSRSFSIPMPVSPQTYVVTTPADSGPGSLRQALTYANANSPATDTVAFNIPGPGPYIIQLTTSGLPPISDSVTIDGATQPGYPGTPVVELRGTASIVEGLLVAGSTAAIRGLVINGFGYAISIGSGSTGSVVEGNYIGTDVTGADRVPNRLAGIFIWSATNTTIRANVISGQGTLGDPAEADGVYVNAGANGTRILANRIGTNAAATAAVGNNGYGVVVTSATAVGTEITGNVISGNVLGGVNIQNGASGTVVQANMIGTGSDTSVAIGNGGHGLLIQNSPATTVGGVSVDAGNVISGNTGTGIYISGASSTGTIVRRNRIGTNGGGTAALPNLQGGVFILNASGNTIGGLTSGVGNQISGNAGVGLGIAGTNATGNVVQGNFIGTNAGGSGPLGNGTEGVMLTNQAPGNTIGGTVPEARNIISGNGNGGVDILSASGNFVVGNYIGTDVTGTAAIPNSNGVTVNGTSSGNTIGGTAAGAGNLISGNTVSGVWMTDTSTTTVVQGNLIGTRRSGDAALGNNIGVLIGFSSANNNIGGATVGARNVISGNGFGVATAGAATGNTIAGNFIGTNVAGSAALPNVSNGVDLQSSGNTVGGTAPGTGNVISGNGGVGVSIGHDYNIVAGNWIGTDPSGSTAIPNTGNGVNLSGSNNTIGGSAPSARNVISGNGGNGIALSGTAVGDSVTGNYIGVNGGGTVALANGGNGVAVMGGSNNDIGVAGAGNVISGNAGNGVYLMTSSGGNRIRANYVGTDATGLSGIPNGGNGVRVDTASNAIGGTGAGDGNTIAFNGFAGVNVSGLSATGNSILGNSVWGNGLSGITLTGGSNNSQIAPGITAASSDGGNTDVTGSLGPGLAIGSQYTIQLFRSTACGPGTEGGQTLLDSFTVTGSVSGFATFSRTVAVPSPLGSFITATATNTTTGDTSQFSTCFAVPAILRLTIAQGETLAGPWGATVTGPNGFSCSMPVGGETVCPPAPFAAGTTVPLLVTLNPDLGDWHIFTTTGCDSVNAARDTCTVLMNTNRSVTIRAGSSVLPAPRVSVPSLGGTPPRF